MATFTVRITSLPLGAQSAPLSAECVGISFIEPHSVGYDLGLMNGDLLIAVNNQSLSGIEGSESLESVLAQHSLPILATFKRNVSGSRGSTSPLSPELVVMSPEVIEMELDRPQTLHSSTVYEEKFHRISSNYSDSGCDSERSRCSVSISGDGKDSLSTIALRSFGEVVLFQSGDFEVGDCAARSTVRQMVRSEPLPPNAPHLRDCPFSEPILCHNEMDSHGFVFLEDAESGRPEMDVVVTYDDIDRITKCLVAGFCRRHFVSAGLPAQERRAVLVVVSLFLFDNSVMFDVSGHIDSLDVHLSSNGFRYGVHEWNVRVVEPATNLQQIGVISRGEIESLEVTGKTPPRFKNVAHSLMTQCADKVFYASYNEGGSSRCAKNLTKRFPKGIVCGDLLTVRLNLTGGRSKVSYYLNGQRVRKVMSLERGKTYYPLIAYSGHGVYELVDFQ